MKEFCANSTVGIKHILASIKMHICCWKINAKTSITDFLFPAVQTSTPNAAYDIVFLVDACHRCVNAFL